MARPSELMLTLCAIALGSSCTSSMSSILPMTRVRVLPKGAHALSASVVFSDDSGGLSSKPIPQVGYAAGIADHLELGATLGPVQGEVYAKVAIDQESTDESYLHLTVAGRVGINGQLFRDVSAELDELGQSLEGSVLLLADLPIGDGLRFVGALRLDSANVLISADPAGSAVVHSGMVLLTPSVMLGAEYRVLDGLWLLPEMAAGCAFEVRPGVNPPRPLLQFGMGARIELGP